MGHMPDIRFECPLCNQSLDAPEELANQLIDCPTCKETIEVPTRSRPAKANPQSTPPPLPPPLPLSVANDPDAPVRCPKCRSTQITANKKGFGLGKAAVGGVLLGPLGLLGGVIGGNKIRITCLKCGHVFQPGESR